MYAVKELKVTQVEVKHVNVGKIELIQYKKTKVIYFTFLRGFPQPEIIIRSRLMIQCLAHISRAIKYFVRVKKEMKSRIHL